MRSGAASAPPGRREAISAGDNELSSFTQQLKARSMHSTARVWPASLTSTGSGESREADTWAARSTEDELPHHASISALLGVRGTVRAAGELSARSSRRWETPAAPATTTRGGRSQPSLVTPVEHWQKMAQLAQHSSGRKGKATRASTLTSPSVVNQQEQLRNLFTQDSAARRVL